MDSAHYEKKFFCHLRIGLSQRLENLPSDENRDGFLQKPNGCWMLMEIKNLDKDNVLRIGVSVYKISGIAIKATFGIWDTPVGGTINRYKYLYRKLLYNVDWSKTSLLPFAILYDLMTEE